MLHPQMPGAGPIAGSQYCNIARSASVTQMAFLFLFLLSQSGLAMRVKLQKSVRIRAKSVQNNECQS